MKLETQNLSNQFHAKLREFLYGNNIGREFLSRNKTFQLMFLWIYKSDFKNVSQPFYSFSRLKLYLLKTNRPKFIFYCVFSFEKLFYRLSTFLIFIKFLKLLKVLDNQSTTFTYLLTNFVGQLQNSSCGNYLSNT